MCLFLFGCAGPLFLPWAFSICDEQGLLLVVVHGLLTGGFSCGAGSAHPGQWAHTRGSERTPGAGSAHTWGREHTRGRERTPGAGSTHPGQGAYTALESVLSSGAKASLRRSMWDLPRSGIEPVSPALAGWFLTTRLVGKPHSCISEELGLYLYPLFAHRNHYKIFLRVDFPFSLFSVPNLISFPKQNTCTLGSFLSYSLSPVFIIFLFVCWFTK